MGEERSALVYRVVEQHMENPHVGELRKRGLKGIQECNPGWLDRERRKSPSVKME